MTHGDDNGLVLPPAVAPIQVVIVPMAQHKPGVLEKAEELQERLSKKSAGSSWTTASRPRGWKFAQYEMKGVPAAAGDRPQGHGEEPVCAGAPGQPGKAALSLWISLEAGHSRAAGRPFARRPSTQQALANLEAKTFTATTYGGIDGHRP